MSPLTPSYRKLVARQSALGLRHAGEALVRPSGTLRVLDGVFVRRARTGWRHVDGTLLRQMRAEAPEGFGPLLADLETMHGRDPSALRRVILYQLIEILQQHPQGALPATAVSLGIGQDEAAALVHAAAARHHHGPGQRASAEELEDALREDRLRSAARLAARLPADGAGDGLLARRLGSLASLVRRVDAALDDAQGLERGGDTETAARLFLQAARLAGDCPGALRGLIRTHAPADGAPGTSMDVRLATDRVDLSWPGSASTARWRLVRVTRTPGGRPDLTEIPCPHDAVWSDAAPPFGHEVRYAALPLQNARISGPPVVSASLLVVPDVSAFRPLDGSGRIEGRWVRPPEALGTTVELTGPDGLTREVPAQEDGFTATGLEAGEHLVRVRCRYRRADGGEAVSPGISSRVTVHPWPAPVRSLSATGVEGRAEFTWSGGENAEVRLVSWPDEPPAPGTELHRSAGPWPPVLDWEGAAGSLTPPSGTLTRVSALAVLGERAVAGPSIRVEAPHPVRSPMAERASRSRARITFDWPPGAGEVLVHVHQDGGSTEHRVARSLYLREGLSVPVAATPLRVVVTAAAAGAADTTVMPVAYEAVLPADVSITYQIILGPRRPLRRRPAAVRVTLTSPGGETPVELPEFVLVARTGDGRKTLRPRRHDDGTTMARLSGDELRRAGTVEREIPAVCRPPYVLRAFLLGGEAASVRLDEPSPATLVVR